MFITNSLNGNAFSVFDYAAYPNAANFDFNLWNGTFTDAGFHYAASPGTAWASHVIPSRVRHFLIAFLSFTVRFATSFFRISLTRGCLAGQLTGYYHVGYNWLWASITGNAGQYVAKIHKNSEIYIRACIKIVFTSRGKRGSRGEILRGNVRKTTRRKTTNRNLKFIGMPSGGDDFPVYIILHTVPTA